MKNAFVSQLQRSAPLLVASLDGDDLASRMEEAKELRADAVEIRLDLWGASLRDDWSEKLPRLRKKIGLPILVSFRGGQPFPSWWQPAHWRSLNDVAMIDIEWNSKYPWAEIQKNVQKIGTSLMISHHDFKQTPSVSALAKIARAAFSKKADLVKFSTQVKSETDLRTLFKLSSEVAPKLVTVMGMGALGVLSRLAAPLFHSCLVYGYIGRPTANGQLPYRELQDHFRRLYPRYEEQFLQRQKQLAAGGMAGVKA